ncbi:MAG: hypothetical protein U0531_18145 [Dehalococcoidia bacterium]
MTPFRRASARTISRRSWPGVALAVLVLGAFTVTRAGAGERAEAAASPSVSLSPISGVAGTRITVTARYLPANQTAQVTWSGVATALAGGTTDRKGSYTATITAPSLDGW